MMNASATEAMVSPVAATMSHAPRVLFVSHTSAVSGAEMVLLDIVQAWRGASAFLFETGQLSEALESRGLRIVKPKWGGSLSQMRRDSSLLAALPLVARLSATAVALARASRQYDVVYANSQKAFVMAAFAALVTRRPLIWHLHDIISDDHFSASLRRLQITLANRCATCVIVPSTAAADAFRQAGGRPGLVQVVPNGIDLTPAPVSRGQLRSELGLPAGPLIGVFSRLAPWKGQHVVLEAMAALPGVHCILAGDALFGEQAYAERLRAYAAHLGVTDRLHFLGQRSDVPRLMQAVDAMVHPSVDPEPFGRTLVEAMLLRTPVIATDTGASSEILAGGSCGDLVMPGDAVSLAKVIATTLAGLTDSSARLDRASARARAHYAAGTMRVTTSGIIHRVAAGAHW